jgi:hypothetical protein
MTDKMQIWKAGEKTDPSFTKENKHGAGGSTSINTTYAFKRATEVFGPIGIGWGYTIVKDEIVEGAPISFGEKELKQTTNSKIHTLQIRFWYVLDGVRGEFDQFGHTDFISKNKWGFATESEPQKKSLSDAIKKALSMLGFMSDIYLGMFDDQSYVQSVALDIAADNAEAKVDREAAKANELVEWVEEHEALFATSRSVQTLGTMHKKAMRVLAERLSYQRINQKQHDYAARRLVDTYNKCKEALENETTVQDK